MKRQSGILMPVFSLPSKYGIGDFGSESYKFVDSLAEAKQSVWQILPLVQTGYGNSPYSSVSSESYNPYYISPEELVKNGLLLQEEADFSLFDGEYIDYGFLYSVRFPLLRKAFLRFDKNNEGFKSFVKEKKYLDYALFMTLKYESGQKHFYQWEDKYKYRDEQSLNAFEEMYKEEILFWQFVQYEAQREWFNLKAYANGKGVNILGDMPLYTALDSVDVWCNPKLYKLNSDFTPKKVAGVPPDYFCSEGQLWGNPVYDYQYQMTDGFSWWSERVSRALKKFDFVRIDHFRGFDQYYEVPFGAKNAINGEWIKVPSEELLNAIHEKCDRNKIIAEDLGIIDDGVRELLKKSGYPGMKVLSFAFNGENDNLYLPERVNENSVCYTGTHDNDTLKGLICRFSEWDYNNFINGVKNSLKNLKIDKEINDNDGLIDCVVELAFACKSNLVIVPVQDLLKFGTEYRINEPGTVRPQNWSVKFKSGFFTQTVINTLKNLVERYERE